MWSLSRRLLPMAVVTAVSVSSLAATSVPVTGLFQVNKQNTRLAFAAAQPGEPSIGRDTVTIVLSEKDPGVGVLTVGRAVLGDYGEAVALTVTREGGMVVDCAAVHHANRKGPFNCLDKIRVKDLSFEGDRVSGKLTSEGSQKTYDNTWKIRLSFQTFSQ